MATVLHRFRIMATVVIFRLGLAVLRLYPCCAFILAMNRNRSRSPHRHASPTQRRLAKHVLSMCRASMCRVCVRQCIWKRDLRGVKIQSDEISMERRAGFAHAAPNCPNLAQGVAERRKTKKRRKLAGRACVATLLQRHVSACLKRVCVIRDARRVCVIQV